MNTPPSESDKAMSSPLSLSDSSHTYSMKMECEGESPGVLSWDLSHSAKSEYERDSHENSSLELSPSANTELEIPQSALPYPDPNTLNLTQDSKKKKSHARKQPAGHIPRPRNAFILFRCDFVRQKKVPEHVEANHCNISTIVGKFWKRMSTQQKAPWIAMAETEKKNHAKAHPGYRYHPGHEARGRDRRAKNILPPSEGEDPSPSMLTYWTPSPSFTPPSALCKPPLRRSLSCPPPGAVPVTSGPSLDTNELGLQPTPLTTRDDLARRPSRTVMYHSKFPLYSFDGLASDSTPQSTAPVTNSQMPQWWSTDPGSTAPLMSGPYSIAPPGDAPGWDAAPAQPNMLYQWNQIAGVENTAGMQPYILNTNFMSASSPWNPGNYASDAGASVLGTPFTNPFDSNATSNAQDIPPMIWYNPPPCDTSNDVRVPGAEATSMCVDRPLPHFLGPGLSQEDNGTGGLPQLPYHASPIDMPGFEAPNALLNQPPPLFIDQLANASDPATDLGHLFPRLSLDDKRMFSGEERTQMTPSNSNLSPSFEHLLSNMQYPISGSLGHSGRELLDPEKADEIQERNTLLIPRLQLHLSDPSVWAPVAQTDTNSGGSPAATQIRAAPST